MKRGDYVRLPNGRVGIYSEPLFGVASRVIMPDWSIETCNMDNLELIGAKKDPNTASSGVWIFTDKWYKTQSQWEGGYFVEGKWVSPKEVKKVKRIDDIRAWMPAGLNNTYEEFVQFLVETAGDISEPADNKISDPEFTKKLERFMDENKPIAPPKVGDYVRCADGEGYVTYVNEDVVHFYDKHGYKIIADVVEVDIITFKPGDRVGDGEGVVNLVDKNGNMDIRIEENLSADKPAEEKIAKYTQIGGLMWKTGEAEIDTVLHMINDYSRFSSEAICNGMKSFDGIDKYVAKKLLEKYTIHRK